MKADPQTEQDVSSVIDRFTGAYAGRDLQAMLSCFAPDDDLVLYGTGRDERRVGIAEVRSQVERDWEQTDSIAMRFDSRVISAAGPVAWAALDGAFELTVGGESMALPARATVVFERRDGRWLVVHAHFSTPSADQEEGHSF